MNYALRKNAAPALLGRFSSLYKLSIPRLMPLYGTADRHSYIVIFVLFLLMSIFGCTSVRDRWKEAQRLDTIPGYHAFLNKHPQNPFSINATKRIEHLYFARCENEDSISSCEEYIRRYPASASAEMALSHIHKIAFQSAKEQQSPSAYQQFLKDYPNSKYSDEARQELSHIEYLDAHREGTIKALQTFASRYSDTNWAEKAQHDIYGILFSQAKEKRSIDAIEQYISYYPESPFINVARSHLDYLKFDHVNADPSIESLQTFIRQNPNSEYLNDAKQLMTRLLSRQVSEAMKHFERASKYMNLELYSQAVQELQWALKIHPKFAEAHLLLAVAYIKEYDKKNVDSKRNNASCLFFCDTELDNAETHARKAQALQPTTSFAVDIFEAIKNRRSMSEFRRLVERLTDLDEDYLEYEINQIVDDFEQLTSELNNEARFWYFLGIAKALKEVKNAERFRWSSWNFYDDGKDELLTATQLQPDFAEAHLWLGVIIARQGFEKARDEGEELLYFLNELYNLWRKGLSDDWYTTEYISDLPYTIRQYLEDANAAWTRAIRLDDTMRDVFRDTLSRVFSGWENL